MAYATPFKRDGFVCCATEDPDTLEDVIDLIGSFLAGKSRRVANAALRIICREALRRLTQDTAPNTQT